MIYEEIGKTIGSLVDEKNKAYGDSFGQSYKILEVLYPNGIKVHQYPDALTITRVLDKLFRIATDKDAFGESPWQDLAGYAILSCSKNKDNYAKKTKLFLNGYDLALNMLAQKMYMGGSGNNCPSFTGYRTKCEIELDKPRIPHYHKCRECVDKGIKYYLKRMKGVC